MKIEQVMVSAVAVPKGHREINPAVVDGLVESMKRVGLLSPILVRTSDKDTEPDVLISGRHRLEAAKRLGWDFIDGYCLAIDDAQARMREITENLHRSELTALERSEQIEEWRVLCEQEAKVLQVATPSAGGKQPKEKGVRKAAKELGIDPAEIARAEKIAKITPAAKAAAKEAGIDDNQSKLLKVAAAEPEKQVEAVKQVAKKSARKTANLPDAPVDDPADAAPQTNTNGKALSRNQRRENAAAEGRRLASRLVDQLDRDTAHALHKFLEADIGNSVFVLARTLGRKLGIDQEDDDDASRDLGPLHPAFGAASRR